MSQPKVTLYGLSTCAACKQASRFFKENQIDFQEVLVDTLEGEAREKAVAGVRKLNPAFSFPTIQVGYKAIVGFREQMVKEALGI